jgi:hypothetical protein
MLATPTSSARLSTERRQWDDKLVRVWAAYVAIPSGGLLEAELLEAE